MFHLTYVVRELRRRAGRTVVTALGLALGVGLVIGIIGVSQGLDDAQGEVLAPLQAVGTDVLVTRVAGSTSDTSTSTSTTVPGRGGFFEARGPGAALNREDTDALLQENANVATDLAKLGKPGEQFTRDFFLSATLLSFPQDAVKQVSELDGVTSAVGGLVQLAQHQTGKVPEIVATLQTGGQTFSQTVRPDPMTDAERQAFRQCLADKGVQIGEAPGPGGGALQGRAGGADGPDPVFDECLPQRFREFQAQITTPMETIRQVVDPPSTDIKNESWTAAGVDPSSPGVGLVTTDQLTKGRWLGKDARNEILLSVAYANKKSLDVGGKVSINGTDYTVVGLVSPTLAGSTADVYFPLATLQELAGKQGRVTQVLVKVDKAASLDAVEAAIRKALPGAEVVTTEALADRVTGSLADARTLAGRLGGVLAAIVLAAAFVIAALLTLSSVSKRVREIGTLRAIGWSKARVVRQLLGETVGIGVLGAVLGIVVGVGVAASVEALSPSLTATTTGVPGITASNLSTFFGQTTEAARTSKVALTAPLHPATLLIGALFALVGGVVAGLLGSWRAARLAPAVALRDLG